MVQDQVQIIDDRKTNMFIHIDYSPGMKKGLLTTLEVAQQDGGVQMFCSGCSLKA